MEQKQPALTPAAAEALVQQLRSAGATERRCKLLDVCSMMRKSLWDLVRISEAGMLETILHMLEATDVQDDELIATSLHMLGLLGSHSITPNQLREHLALFTRGGLTCRLLQPLVHAVELSEAAGPLGCPASFLAFDGQGGLAATMAKEVGPSSFSVWLWLRLESPSGASGEAQSQAGSVLVYSLLAADGHGVEVRVRAGRLSVAVLSARGGVSAVQLERPLQARSWHWLGEAACDGLNPGPADPGRLIGHTRARRRRGTAVEHATAARRWSLSAALASTLGGGGRAAPAMRVYVDGRLELEAR